MSTHAYTYSILLSVRCTSSSNFEYGPIALRTLMSETKIQTLSQSTKAGWFQVLVFGFREPTCEAGRRAPGATATGNRASASPPNSRIDICVFVTCVLCVRDFPNGTLSYPYPLSPIYLMLPLNIINMTKSFTLRPVFNATRGYVADMF